MLLSRTVPASAALAVAFLILLVFSSEARADDIVISNGSLAIGGAPNTLNAWSNIGFNFSGNGFAASGAMSDNITQGIMSPCAFNPCQPGATIFPNSRATLDGVGQATFNGMTVPAWWLGHDSNLFFNGPGVTIPLSTDPFITITTPFTMTGSVIVHSLEGDISHPVIFSTTIRGSGIATMTLNFFPRPGSGGYIYSNVRYDFQPVPEPATLLLLGTGLAGLVARFRGQRSKN